MSLRPVFNPLNGELDLVSFQTDVEVAAKVQETFDCAQSTSIGDLVVPSEILNDTVESVSTNYYPNLVFGVVVAKPTPTRATVLVSGRLQGSQYQLMGLDFGKALYVSPLGKLTTTPPTTGHVQRLGIAIKSDSVFLLPSMDKVIRA